jgi:hypothetical protein
VHNLFNLFEISYVPSVIKFNARKKIIVATSQDFPQEPPTAIEH